MRVCQFYDAGQERCELSGKECKKYKEADYFEKCDIANGRIRGEGLSKIVKG